jgi:Dullard-like phosphatase family protein
VEKDDTLLVMSLAELFENGTDDTHVEPHSLNSNNAIPDIKPTPFQLQMETIDFEYVESSQNFQGNYHNYVYKALKSIAEIRKLDFSGIISEKSVALMDQHERVKKKTLVLDLDETLIHADFDGNFPNPDNVVTFKYDDYDVSVPIFIRPGLTEFLTTVNEHFELAVFTASRREYADAVLNFLDPENKFFKQRFYRENCICVKGRVFVKDLRMFSNRKEENIVMVDNSMYSFGNQLSNGVLINSFYNDRTDRELINLLNYLQNYLLTVPDVRSVNEQVFNFSSTLEEISNC